MRKVGLITISSVPNYGSVLQAYATQIVLESMGIDCKIINYDFPNIWQFEQGAKPLSLKYKIGVALGLKSHHQKQKQLNKFKQRNFNYTKRFRDFESLQREDWSSYDTVAVGSDQVWNPRFTYGDPAFMLSFVPDNVKRISLSSSFACNLLQQQYKEVFKKQLSKFYALSIREKNGLTIIKEELGIDKEVAVLLDPTLLLSKDEWLKKVPRSLFKKQKKYIVLYGLYYAFDSRPYIYEVLQHYAIKYNYDILALEGYAPIAGVNIIDKTSATLEEFIDIFANADLVITSSFHGTAFALNFGIPLVSIVPEGGSDDRQTTLCNLLGADSCIISVNNQCALLPLLPIYTKSEVAICLEQHRVHSLHWIKEHI